jgi:signal transduction histidine kinase
VEADTRHIAFYSRVPPGDYTFRVIACNNDGVWNTTGASVTLTLQPHFWQTWWFKLFLGGTCLSLVAASARYATKRRMQFKLERLEQQHAVEKERSRIAQDMHDDLGSQLTEIQLLSDLALGGKSDEETKTHVAKISGATREVVRGLGTIVWAVNPRNDSLDNLADYLYEYVQRVLSLRNIQCRLEAVDVLPRIPISASVRRDIFLVVKEALNNVIKHSGATEVRFALRAEGQKLLVVIEDNGKGFALEEQTGSGNGLLNMESRTAHLGGKYLLQSQRGRGTSIRLEVPLPD